MKNHQIILNLTAGGGRTKKKWKKIKKYLAEQNFDYDLHITEHHLHGIELGKQFAETGEIIVVGGDGTFNEVANGILRSGHSDCNLGMIPTGTGKDLPNTLGIPADYEKAFQTIINGHTRKIDVGQVTGEENNAESRYFLGVASFGFDADIANRANQGIRGKKLPGSLNYVFAIIRSLAKLKDSYRRFKITMDGQEKEMEVLWIAVGNGRFYGGGIMICPGSSVYDQELQVTIVGEEKVGRLKVLRVLPKAYDGKHVSDSAVKVYRAKKLRLELASRKETPCIYQVDGEVLGHVPAAISIAEKRLNVYIPEDYEEEVHELKYDTW